MAGSQDIGALVVTLEAQTAAFEKGMAQATKSLQGFGTASKAIEGQFAGFQGQLEKFNRSVQGLRNATAIVTSLFQAFAGFTKAREDILALQSSFTNLMGSSEDAEDMIKRIYRVSKDIGIAVPVATDAIRRMSIGMINLGYSNKQIEETASTFLKIGAVTSSVKEAAGAVFQFAQALGSGALRGDELISLLERQPAIANEIARYTKEIGLSVNGTTGELRKLGSEGVITTEILVAALASAKDRFDKDFEKMPLKMEQVINRMKISWNEFQVDISERFMLNEKLAKYLGILQQMFEQFLINTGSLFTVLADNIELVSVALAGLVTIIGVKLVAALGLATVAARAFSLATGWGALILGITAFILYWDKLVITLQEADIYLTELQISFNKFFGSDTSALDAKLQKLNEKLARTKLELKASAAEIDESGGNRTPRVQDAPWLAEFKKQLKKNVEEAGRFQEKIATIQQMISETKDPKALKVLNEELQKLQKSTQSPMTAWLKGITDQEVGGSLKSVTDQIKLLDAELAKATDPIKIQALLSAREQVVKKFESATIAKGTLQVREASKNFQEQMQINKDALIELNDQFALGQISAQQYYAQLGSFDTSIYAEMDIAIYNANKQLEEMPLKLAYIDQALADGRITPETWEKLRNNIQGVNSDMQKLGEDIAVSIGSNASNAVNNFIDNLGQAKFSFSDFATSVVKDLAKIMMQMLIMQPLIKSFKSFLGMGFAGNAGPELLNPFAKGGSFENGTGLAHGVYNSPTLFKFAKGGTFGRLGVLGEAGAEAIMPLKRGSDGKLGVSSAPTTVNIYNNAAVEVTATENTNADGMKSVDILIEKKVKDMFGTGQMDKSMKSAYGLNRAAA